MDHNPTVFPHPLVRLGGLSYDSLEAMDSAALDALNRHRQELSRRQHRQKESLSEQLFRYIEQQSDSRLQNRLQNLRRDLYNDRPLKSKQRRLAKEQLPVALYQSLQDYLALLDEQQAAQEEASQTYRREIVRLRTQLQQLAREEALRQGLVLSSQTLLQRLSAFGHRPADAFGKKELRVEQSLLKYLPRMQAKTSPFSTFNNLCVGQLDSGSAHLITLSDQPSEVQSHIRLNNQLYRYLKDLFGSYRAVYTQLPLRVNPTLERSPDSLRYLTNHNNVEAFQRLPPHPIVLRLLERAQETAEGVRFNQLQAQLLDEVEATPEALEAYIKQLIDYGLLEYDLGVSGIDPDWDQHLIPALRTLARAGVPHVSSLIDTLQHLRDLSQHFGQADASARQAVLTEAYDAFRDVCLRIHEAADLPADERLSMEDWVAKQQQKQVDENVASSGEEEAPAEADQEAKETNDQPFRHQSATHFSFRPEQLFYEDTTRSITPTIRQETLADWVTTLHDLLAEVSFFQSYEDERTSMIHYFRNQYPPGTDVRLLTFYEDYYRDVKKPEAQQKEALAKEDTPASQETALPPETQARHDLMKRWQQRLEVHLRSEDRQESEVFLDIDVLRQINEELAIPTNDTTPNSYGSFVQFYAGPSEGGPLMGVLNGVFPGYGKMMSRFMHIVPPVVLQDARDWNQAVMGNDALFIEDCDASYFNANLHPPLLPFEVRMPGGHNSLPVHQQLPISDFVVRYLPETSTLALIHHPSGKRAYPFDLGFQGHGGRSQLFQLLEKFTHAEYRSLRAIINVVNAIYYPAASESSSAQTASAASQEVVILPRLVLGGKVVAQRKTWLVPFGQLPLRAAPESEADYFFRVRAWQRAQGIPDQVFVYVNTYGSRRTGGDPASEQRLRKLRRDDYKPQFISLANPLSVQLFEKLVKKVPYQIKVVEMLPNGSQMLRHRQQRYVTEWVVQWYTTTPTSSSEPQPHYAHESL